MTPFVSVVVPCYNAESFISETIQSVLAQTYSSWELIIVDDGSRDDSAKIIQSFQDERIRYFYQENAGVSCARNTGIAQARGKYIAFLDADDLYLPENLEKKVNFLENHPGCVLVHSDVIDFDSATGKPLAITSGTAGKVLNDLLEMSKTVVYSPTSVMLRRAIMEQHEGFDPNLSTSADWEMWVQMARRGDFGRVAEPLVKYRLHSAQMHQNIPRMEQDMRYAFEKLRKEQVFQSKAHYRYCLARLSLILSACYLKDARNYGKFLQFFGKSLFNHPAPLLERLFKIKKN